MSGAIIYERTFFADTNGTPLDGGKVYIGQTNKDPEVYPIQCYWDEALTIAAAQPLSVTSGYITYNGARRALWTAEPTYSMRVRNKTNVIIDYIAKATADVPSTASTLGPVIIAIAGQSNAVGKYGDTTYNPYNVNVKTWDSTLGKWQSGGKFTSPPWTYAAPDGNSSVNNFALAAAHYIQQTSGRKVYIVYDALSGQSIDQWVGSGTSSTRYAALDSKVTNALADPELVAIGKSKIDLFIWAQGEEDALTMDYATYLGKLGTLDTQLKAEPWMDDATKRLIISPSPLHYRYQPFYAMRDFCARANGRWRFVSTASLRTPYQENPANGDYTHWTAYSLWRGGYNIIGPMYLNEGDQGEFMDAIGLFWGRASSGMATPSEPTVIVTFDNLVNWQSRTGGFLSETLSGDGSTRAFLLDYRGTTISSVTVGGVARTAGAIFTGSMAGTTTLTVSAVTSGTLVVGESIWDASNTLIGTIASLGTGTGGTGTYILSASATKSSQTMYAAGATEYVPSTATNDEVTLLFGAAPASASSNIVVSYGATVNGPAAVGSMSFGYANFADGNYSFALGSRCATNNVCNYTLVGGRDSWADGTADYSFSWGFNLTMADPYGAVFGRWNAYTTAQSDPAVLQIGVGTGSGSRSNALTVRQSGVQEQKTTTFASLPAAGVAGRRAFITDSSVTTFNTNAAGGGANRVPVFDDGTNWKVG